PHVLIPAHPGILAATGLLATDEKFEFVGTARFRLASADTWQLQTSYSALEADALQQFQANAISEDRRVVRRLADARYEGQGYEIRFAVPDGEITPEWLAETEALFHAAHEAEYGHRFK